MRILTSEVSCSVAVMYELNLEVNLADGALPNQ